MNLSRLKKLNEEFDKLEKENKELLEFALDRSKVKNILNDQMIPISQHILKLQLYGYESDIVKNIYDIYSKIDELNDSKKGRSFLTEENIKNWLFTLFEDEDDYLNGAKRLDKRIGDNYQVNNRKLSYTNYHKVEQYIINLLISRETKDKQEFTTEIKNILEV